MNLMGSWEIQKRLGVSSQRVNQIATKESFPRPVAVLAAGRIWLSEDIERWIAKYRATVDQP